MEYGIAPLPRAKPELPADHWLEMCSAVGGLGLEIHSAITEPVACSIGFPLHCLLR